MALISFSRATAPIASITFTDNPSIRQYGGKEDYYQTVIKSEGASIFVYDYGLESNQVLNFQWAAVSYGVFTNLMGFYETMKKTRYSFTFSDFDSNTSTARFFSPINWTYIKDTLLTVSFDIWLNEDRAY